MRTPGASAPALAPRAAVKCRCGFAVAASLRRSTPCKPLRGLTRAESTTTLDDRARRERSRARSGCSVSAMRVLGVSDLHTDYAANLDWARQLSESTAHRDDVLVVAGDVSDDLGTFAETMRLLSAAFRAVAFVPGNHDLWVRRKERGLYDSLGKLERLTALCGELGVATAPTRYADDGIDGVEAALAAFRSGDGGGGGKGGGVGGAVSSSPSLMMTSSRGSIASSSCSPSAVPPVYVFPLLSWYHSSWDREPDVPGSAPIERVMMDFHVCSFSSEPHLEGCGHESVSEHLDLLNEPGFGRALEALEAERLARLACGLPPPVVVSASHFLPHQALLPDKRFLRFPNLAKASGSDYLSRRVEALGPAVHIFGHTHFRWDATLPDGVRYVQCPLGYPAERARNGGATRPWEPWVLAEPDEVLRAWREDLERGEGGLPAQKQCYWSSMIPREVSAMRYRQGLQGRERGQY